MLVNEFLEQSASRLRAKTAVVCDRRRYSYEEINAAANRFANCLLRYGLIRQERVVVYLPNSAEAVVSIFGVLKAGGVFVVVNPLVKPDRLEYILRDCNAIAIVTTCQLFKSALSGLERCPNLRHVFLIDAKRVRSGGSSSRQFESLAFHRELERSVERQPFRRSIDIDLASIIYTSGSSGNPKGVMLTHLNMVSAAHSIIEYLENTPDDIILNCLPLSFDYGLYQVLMAFQFGGTVILENGFVFPYQTIELLKKEKVTGFPIVPAMAVILLHLKDVNHLELPSLRYITSTAQAFPPEHLARMREIFPGAKTYSMYGLTECKRVSYLPPGELARRPASVGKAMPNTEVYLVGEDDRVITSPWTVGELVVRGASVMRGYWNLPEETAKRLRPGIYPGEYVLYTGDIFQMDEEGFLYFVSRQDDIIKTGGEMVSPKEVENVLYELADVREAAVVPVEDEVLGFAIKAVVVLREKSALKRRDIIKHCALKLERFKIPKHVDIRFTLLPKTSSGKIAKRELQ
ncbi:MAG: AMP-binding protein [Deltaproteobacteria bacterium]|nr:AMP-binding protein [Deltaproteobacteria bacterium]